MTTEATERKDRSERETIKVNEMPVKMTGERATGRDIKAAAIAQQVNIKMDFVLSAELKDRKSRIIGDSDTVDLDRDREFTAIAGDDNS